MPARMKQCPTCKAPNPSGRLHCYACGDHLGNVVESDMAAAARAKEKTYPCANCKGAVPFSAPACPHCGRVAVNAAAVASDTPAEEPFPLPLKDAPAPPMPPSPDRVRLVPPPFGWEAEPLPDGTVLLTRRTWGRLSADATVPAMLIVAAFVTAQILSALGRRGSISAQAMEGIRWLVAGCLVGAGLGALYALAWAALGRDELRVGPDLLEVRRCLLGRERVRRLPHAVFRLETRTNYGDSRGSVTHRLLAESVAGRIILDSKTRPKGREGLASEEEARDLGRFLAAKTGWAFTDPGASGYLR